MGPTRRVLDKPVIAAIEGHAVAGGLELALWCDLRVAADDAVLGVFCRRWGVPLVDGGTVRLPRLIGLGHALDLDAHRARGRRRGGARMGLATRVVPGGHRARPRSRWRTSSPRSRRCCLRSDRASLLRAVGSPPRPRARVETGLGREVLRSGEASAGAARFARAGRPDAAGRARLMAPGIFL